MPATPLAECDAVVARLKKKSLEWPSVGIARRRELLEACTAPLLAIADEWVSAGCRAKGYEPGSIGEGEEWVGGPMILARGITLLSKSLAQGGQPKMPGLRQRPNGQWAADVFPGSWQDKLMFTGFRAEIRVKPGEEPTQGHIYREKAAGRPSKPCVSLVLGAGNVSSIGPLDTFQKLFVEDEVVVLKMNPVNEYLGPFVSKALAPLIEEGLLELVYGGAEVGAHLCQHPDVGSVHITGSERTHDCIVWGLGDEEQQRRKAADDPVLNKPITSELGCVTPVVVVPGPWSPADLKFQARNVASMVTQNASFNCNAAKILVVSKDWPQRGAFLTELKGALSRTPSRKAYYPGAQDRYDGFLEHYPQAEALGERVPKTEEDAAGIVPWTVIDGVPAETGEYALTNEAFCGVIAVVDLPGTNGTSFLENAVPFCNDVAWGTLSAGIIVHPDTEKAHGTALENAIDEMRYGAVGVNVWPALAYGLAVTAWGAYPGHPLSDIRSGIGTVHNTYMLDHPEKSVVRAPFRIRPTPAWFGDHRNLAELGRRITYYEANPTITRLPGVIMAALKG